MDTVDGDPVFDQLLQAARRKYGGKGLDDDAIVQAARIGYWQAGRRRGRTWSAAQWRQYARIWVKGMVCKAFAEAKGLGVPLPDRSGLPDRSEAISPLEGAVAEAFGGLDPLTQAVLAMHLGLFGGEAMTLREIEWALREYRLTVEHVRAIRDRGLAALDRHVKTENA